MSATPLHPNYKAVNNHIPRTGTKQQLSGPISPEEPLLIKFEAFCRQPTPPERDLELHADQLRVISRQGLLVLKRKIFWSLSVLRIVFNLVLLALLAPSEE